MSVDATTGRLVLELDEIEEGVTQLDAQVTSEALELEDAYYTFGQPAFVHLEVHRALETFTLAGTVETRVRGECCRCLAETELQVRAELRLLFQRKEATQDELEAVAEEEAVEILPPGARELDLTCHVRDAILLELPLRIYCRPDCRGLCPHCGKDLNQGPCGCTEEQTDPRWEALRNIKFE